MALTLTESDTSKFVTTNDWRIHYNEAGQGEGRQVVILLHGSGPGATGWSNFKPNLGKLAERFHVLAVDMPGWGKSDPVKRDQLDHVKASAQFLDALGIEKAAFVGNSMGGITALRFATEHPERMTHLITMGPGSGPQPKLFSPGDGPTEGMKILIEGYRNPTADTMKRLVDIMTFDAAFASDELAEERARGAQANPQHLENYLDAAAQGGPIPKWFGLQDLLEVDIPALLIHGRDDRVVPYENSLLLLSHLKYSRLVLINRCGHWAQLEHAEEFNRTVNDFITHN